MSDEGNMGKVGEEPTKPCDNVEFAAALKQLKQRCEAVGIEYQEVELPPRDHYAVVSLP